MVKFSINLMVLLSSIIISSAHAGNQNDVKKLDAFLKKEAPGAPAAALDLSHEDMRAYDLVNPDGGGKEFDGANMEGTNFSGKDLKGLSFSKVNLKGANLFRVSMVDTDKEGVSFGNATTKDCSGMGWFS